MQKKSFQRFGGLLLAGLCTQATILTAETQHVILTSKVLKFIDGISRTMDGRTILDMKIISHKLRDLIYGHLDPQTKKKTGSFIFQDKSVSLHTLCRIEERIQTVFKSKREELEKQYLDTSLFTQKWNEREQVLMSAFDEQVHKIEEEMMQRHKSEKSRDIAIKQARRNAMRKYEALIEEELKALKKEHMSNFAQFTHELAELEHDYMQQMQLLAPALAQAKKAFSDITLPFMEQARGAKDFMVPLIEEWAEKAGHKDSMLLRWSEEESGSEMRMFEHDITSCARLNNMCTNLVDFLASLIASCPKALEQYEVLKNKLTHTT